MSHPESLRGPNGWWIHLEWPQLSEEEFQALWSVLTGETIEEWMKRMDLKSLKQLERILRAGTVGAGNTPFGNSLMRMLSECRKMIREEESSKDPTDG